MKDCNGSPLGLISYICTYTACTPASTPRALQFLPRPCIAHCQVSRCMHLITTFRSFPNALTSSNPHLISLISLSPMPVTNYPAGPAARVLCLYLVVRDSIIQHLRERQEASAVQENGTTLSSPKNDKSERSNELQQATKHEGHSKSSSL